MNISKLLPCKLSRKQRIFMLAVTIPVLFSCTVLDSRHADISSMPKSIEVNFDAPKDWKKHVVQRLITYTAPEGNASISVVTVTNQASAQKAAKIAWRQYNSQFNRVVRINEPEPIRGGWDKIRDIEYITSPAEERVVNAYAYQKGKHWKLVLMDGHTGTFSKRRAAVRTMIQSFALSGYEPENLAPKMPNQLTSVKVNQIKDFVAESAKSLGIPGVGFALIEKGEIIFEGGVGLKSITSGELVNKNTRFMVASNTKGMTTLLLAKLVEMGKLNWDDKVVEHYPEFKLGGSKVTESVLIRHLICACTGLPRKDLDWVFNSGPDIAAKITFDDLASTKPTSGFGEIYQYNNQMAAAAGYIAGHLLYPDMELGAAYDKAMQEYIFNPLGMKDTTFSFSEALSGDLASPHGLDIKGNIISIEQSEARGFNHVVYPYRPAGAAWSTPHDMIKYVQNELTAGVSADGHRIFAEAPLLERRKPMVSSGKGAMYGMGLESKTVAGIEIVQHGGSLLGYLSNIIIIPKANVGAVILTNSESGYQLLEPFTRRLIEVIYDAEDHAKNQVAVAVEQQQLLLKKQREELGGTPDENIISNLARHYQSDQLGTLAIRSVDGRLVLDPGVWSSEFTTKLNSDKTHSLVLISPGLTGAELVIGEEKGLRTLMVKDAQHSYTFVEIRTP